MLGQVMFTSVDECLYQATGKRDQPLGGISVILFCDFALLVMFHFMLLLLLTNLYMDFHGYTIYWSFKTAVMLTQVLRQSGNDSLACSFREFLMHLRDGEVTQEVWHSLLSPESRQPWLVYRCNSRILWQKEHGSVQLRQNYVLLDHQLPLYIQAIHSDAVAGSAKPDDAGGLHPWWRGSCYVDSKHIMTKSRSLQWHCRNSIQAVVSGRQSPSLTSHSCPGSIWPLYWTNVHLAMSPTVFLSHPRLSNGKSTQGSSCHSNCVMPSPFTRARDRPFQEQSLTLANLNFQWGAGLLLFQGKKKSLNTAYFTQWHSKGYKTFLNQRDYD